MSSTSRTENQWIGVLIWSGLTVLITTTGLYSVLRQRGYRDTQWYKKLKKPAGVAPAWVFSVAWPIMYGFITASIWVYWRLGAGRDRPEAVYNITLALYVTQLVLNGLWILIFFVAHKTGTAAVDLSLVLAISIAKVVLFGVQRVWISFGLFLPYVFWLAYTMYLNLGIVLLNP